MPMFSPLLNVIINLNTKFYGHVERDLIPSGGIVEGLMEVGPRFEGQR